MDKHIQCRLSKADGSRQVAWIPQEHAKSNTYVKLKQDDGSWQDGWCVEEVAVNTVLPSTYVAERSRDWKKQRGASDI